MKVTFNEAAVGDYVMGLAEKYNTIGSTRTIVSGSGSTITVDGGAFGWQIDQESEVEVLLSNIKNGEVVTREPEYYSWGKTHEEGNDIGSTFAEVDLTNQVMYYVKDGQVVMKADVVTGNPTTDHATPSGVYSVMYKQLDATLRGDKDENGNYEWETPVKYWMQFTSDGCGFHDATWQSAFGGDRYLTYGSHGCVNMSYDEAGQLYDIIQAGDPVVVHY
jgi:lipoprotein-anchoring transpeptidase ErfK/SrfK